MTESTHASPPATDRVAWINATFGIVLVLVCWTACVNFPNIGAGATKLLGDEHIVEAGVLVLLIVKGIGRCRDLAAWSSGGADSTPCLRSVRRSADTCESWWAGIMRMERAENSGARFD